MEEALRRQADRPRRATNVSLEPRLIEKARAARWRVEIGEAIAASNSYADELSLPLASLRLF